MVLKIGICLEYIVTLILLKFWLVWMHHLCEIKENLQNIENCFLAPSVGNQRDKIHMWVSCGWRDEKFTYGFHVGREMKVHMWVSCWLRNELYVWVLCWLRYELHMQVLYWYGKMKLICGFHVGEDMKFISGFHVGGQRKFTCTTQVSHRFLSYECNVVHIWVSCGQICDRESNSHDSFNLGLITLLTFRK